MDQQLIVLFVERDQEWCIDMTADIPEGYRVIQVSTSPYRKPFEKVAGSSDLLAITLLLERI